MSSVHKGRTVLLVIDAQNSILNERGLAAGLGVWKHAKETMMVANTRKALAKARQAGIPVIYVQTSIRPQTLPAIGFWKQFKGLDVTKIDPREIEFQVGIVDELAPRPGDCLITKYNTMDAFHNTGLEKKLRELGADTLLVTGVATNFCVETTVRSAFNRGYHTVVLTDCVATINQESQDFFLNVIYPLMGKASTVEELTFGA